MSDLFIQTNTNTLLPQGNGGRRIVEGTRDGALFTAEFVMKLAMQGRIFCATDADADDKTAAAATSFADTTPTFIIDVPSGTTAIPLKVHLTQAGTVAGAVIFVTLAVSSGAISYASGGVAETIYGARSDKPVTQNCAFYSNPTTTTGLLTKQVASYQMGQDVSPAEGAVPEVLWTPQKNGFPLFVVGPASFGVFTYAGTTGPQWLWDLSWAEVPSTWVTG